MSEQACKLLTLIGFFLAFIVLILPESYLSETILVVGIALGTISWISQKASTINEIILRVLICVIFSFFVFSFFSPRVILLE